MPGTCGSKIHRQHWMSHETKHQQNNASEPASDSDDKPARHAGAKAPVWRQSVSVSTSNLTSRCIWVATNVEHLLSPRNCRKKLILFRIRSSVSLLKTGYLAKMCPTRVKQNVALDELLITSSSALLRPLHASKKEDTNMQFGAYLPCL